jgi:hypothetical protein
LGACSSANSQNEGSFAPGVLPGPEDAAFPSDADDAALHLATSVRLAHMMVGLGRIDVCIQAPGESSYGSPLFGSGGLDSGVEPFDASSSFDGAEGPADVLDDLDSVDADLDAAPRDSSALDSEALDAGSDEFDSRAAAADVGLSALSLSRYFELEEAGTFLFGIVPAGAGCNDPFFTQQVTLQPGDKTTVVLAPALSPLALETDAGIGEAAKTDAATSMAPARLLVFVDEPDEASSAPRTRFIDIAPSETGDASRPILSVGVLDRSAKLWPLAAAISPDSVASPSSIPPTIDALGYNEGSVLTGMLAIRIGDQAGTLSWTGASTNLELGPNSVHTGFIVGEGRETYHVVWCDDDEQSDLLSLCTSIGP